MAADHMCESAQQKILWHAISNIERTNFELINITFMCIFLRKRKCPIDRLALDERSAKVSTFLLHYDYRSYISKTSKQTN